MTDGLGVSLPFDYLRVSVTNRCQLNCPYCRPERGGAVKAPLPIAKLADLCEAICDLAPIRKIRISGGEPLVRPGLLDFVARLVKLPARPEVTLTTNGVLLEELAAGLAEAGLHRLNVHVDHADPAAYERWTGAAALDRVVQGLAAARAAGFHDMKINSVLTSSFDAAEARRLLALAADSEAVLRLIELMPMGFSGAEYEELFLSADEALDRLAEVADLAKGPTSLHRRLLADLRDGRRVTVEMVEPMSRPFCDDCRRVRVACDGTLLPCLLSPVRIPAVGDGGALPGREELAEMLARCVSLKQRRMACLPERMWAVGG